jgi:moderate conductance mechanosensitive channel
MFFGYSIPHQINQTINNTLGDVHTWRAVFIFLVALIIAIIISNIFARIVVRIAQAVAVRADTSSTEERGIQLRRVETYLSVITTILRGLILLAAAYIALRLIAPQSSGLLTTIGAGTVFAVIAAGTVSPLVRDIAYGALMIIERWYSVGDFVRVIPFTDVVGVVERVTLRATKLRNINGEVIWIHNQYIQGVKTTPRGLRTLAIDVFVRDLDAGLSLISDISKALPTGPTMLASPLEVGDQEKLAPKLWRIAMTAQTAPGREWLIEDFMVQALKDADEERSGKKIITYGPIVRYSDRTAEKRYRRAVRVAKPAAKSK